MYLSLKFNEAHVLNLEGMFGVIFLEIWLYILRKVTALSPRA
jgi:hypothetical protein